MRTPWGKAQTVDEVADGIVHVTTATHGGMRLSDARRGQMPESIRQLQTFAGGNWYEEDCDVALVIMAFPDVFGEDKAERARVFVEKELERGAWGNGR